MNAIDVHDLPESIVSAIVETVENLRKQLAGQNGHSAPLPLWHLGTQGRLSRLEIYDDLDRDV